MRIFFILAVCLLLAAGPAQAKKSTFYFNKIYDYPQAQLEEIIPNYDRGAFCAPTGASNILKTFHANRIDQGEMIKLLASPEYMNTNPATGTKLNDFMDGLAKYMNTELRGYRSIEYSGLGRYPGYHTGQMIPTLDWITDGLGMKKGVWLAIHMLKHDPARDEYHFVGGHLITLVGYTVDSRNSILVVHDSASPPEEGRDKEFLHFEPIESGNLVVGQNYTIPAKGFLKVSKGQKLRYATTYPYDTIIISGAVRIDGNN